MASIYDWNKYINLLHEFALVEDRLRDEQAAENVETHNFVTHVLYANFGVYP